MPDGFSNSATSPSLGCCVVLRQSVHVNKLTSMDSKLILSIYAAVISTIVFLWRLYEFFDDKKGKIRVTLNISNEIPVFQNNKLGDWQAFLVATVTNVGKHKRLIERPHVKIDKTIDGKDVYSVINFNDKTNFPFSLEPGQKYDYKMPMEAINNNFKNIGVKMIAAIIKDTHGKAYKSKQFNIQ